MRFGLGISNCRRASQVEAHVRDAETLGAEIAFVSEDINCRDAFELCTLAAVRTERIRISTGVVNPYTRNPTSIAMAVATLDEISNGRAGLGLGTSSPSLVEEQMGIPIGRGVGVMMEATEVVRALLSGGSVDYAGERFIYRQARLEVTPVQGHIPIVFAAMGPLMLQLAGRIADGVLLNVGSSPQYVRWAVGEIEKGLNAAGRSREDFTVAAWIATYISTDVGDALRRATEWLPTMLSIPRQGELLLQHSGLDTEILPRVRSEYMAYPHRGDRVAAARHIPPEIAQALTIVGTREQARERLEEYRNVGVDLPVVGPSALRDLF
jgi:5,10-methylenetetrahydromethanopterin reductase